MNSPSVGAAALHFTTADRQWVVTAYTLSFGSLLLLGGRLADVFGRKVTFLVGLLGFAGVSAIGGASVNFAMLVTARACQGAFAAILVPSALSLLTTTFTEPKIAGKAFGVYGAIAAAGGAVGLLLGGALTEYLSWRWTFTSTCSLPAWPSSAARCCSERHPSPVKPGSIFRACCWFPAACSAWCTGSRTRPRTAWNTPSTYGFLIAGVALLAVFAFWQTRAPNPLLPPRVVLDRNRGGAYLSMLIASAAMFGTFLFLTYYLQQTLGYTPIVTGFAVLPIVGGIAVSAKRVHHRAHAQARAQAAGRGGDADRSRRGGLVCSAGAAHQLRRWRGRPAHPDRRRTRHGHRTVHQHGHVRRGPAGRGSRLGHGHRQPQLGASIGASLLNTVFASAVTSYVAAMPRRRAIGLPELTGSPCCTATTRGSP